MEAITSPMRPPAGIPPFIDKDIRSRCRCRNVGRDKNNRQNPIIRVVLDASSSFLNFFQPTRNRTNGTKYAAPPTRVKRMSDR